MQVLRRVPQLAEELEDDLTYSLKVFGEHLASKGQGENARWLYSQAMTLLPSPKALLTNLGALLYSMGLATASLQCFTQVRETREPWEVAGVQSWIHEDGKNERSNQAYPYPYPSP
ncbi:unnamed protein product [Discosporangium mesarthrocarpum]